MRNALSVLVEMCEKLQSFLLQAVRNTTYETEGKALNPNPLQSFQALFWRESSSDGYFSCENYKNLTNSHSTKRSNG